MEAREKAKDLVDKYLDIENYNNLNLDLFCDECGMSNDVAKICALIAVDEILNLGLHDIGDYRNAQSSLNDFSTVTWYINYWQEVKQEIQKL